MSNQIQLKGEFRREEALASGTVKPGMLLEVTSTGAVKAHATSGGFAERAFAVEDALQGNTIDDNYSSADLVSYNLVYPGGEVYAILNAGENVAIGDQLISNADGTLIKTTGTPKQIIGIAMEALDLSASAAVDTRMAVRVL